jgi:Fe-coproporphyrin III synthase
LAQTPHAVRLVLTQKCNLACVHCLADARPHAARNELTTDEWLLLICRLRELKVFDISLTGGEMLTRPDIITLLEQLAIPRFCRITMVTNGTLITPAIAQQLQELKIRNILISIDGMQRANDRIRGEGAFDQATTGLRHLLA